MKPLIITLGVIFVIALVSVAVFTLKVNRPGLALSTLMPGHNAFDYFQQAATLEESKTTVDDAGQTHPTREYSLAQKESLLKQNAPALAKLREGLKYAYMNPPVTSMDQKFPYYAQFRSLARLLHLESEVETAGGTTPARQIAIWTHSRWVKLFRMAASLSACLLESPARR